MSKMGFEIFEKTSKQKLVLVVDQEGMVGKKFIERLRATSIDTQIVFVSKSVPQLKASRRSLLTIPFKKKVPTIPNANYSEIVLIYNGEEKILDILKACVEKAEATRARLALVLPVRANSKERAVHMVKGQRNAAIIYIGDIFSYNPSDSQTLINRFLTTTRKTKRIRVANNGLEKIYPILLGDVIDGIIEALFNESLVTKNFFVFPRQTQTQLSMAHILQRIDPLITVDFVKERENEIEDKIPKDGKYLMPENYDLRKKLRDVFESLPLDQKKNTKENEIKKSPQAIRKSRQGIPMFIIIFLISSFLMPSIFLFIFSFLALTQLNFAKNSLENGKTTTAKNSINNASFFFSTAEKTETMVLLEASLVGQKENAINFFNTVSIGKQASIMISSALEASDEFMRGEDLLASSEKLKRAITIFQQLKAEKLDILSSFDFPSQISASIDIIPDILGINKKRVYLVLFQNNMELRPGGGFIGSYGLLILDKGKIVDFTIHDVYDADGQLKGHVEPPFPIRRYLPSSHWYLRDSNWDVDFSKSASQSAYFLNLETGVLTDGVIGVDVSFIKNLLEVTGPISVSDYNEIVNSGSLYEITQKHAEQDFFPGSTQKKDFLRSLFIAIRENIFSQKDISYSKLAKALQKGIEQKHVLFAFADNSLQNVFSVNGMSSSLFDPRVKNNNIINDFLGINEANLGANKANYFISRNVSHEVNLGENGNIQENLKITYKNTGQNRGESKEDYKNYLRIVVSSGTRITSITIDGISQTIIPAITDYNTYEAKNYVAPKELELEEVGDGDKTVFGFYVVVPKNTTKTITIQYSLNNNLSLSLSSLTYNLMLFKQPGIDSFPYGFSFLYPDNFSIVSSAGGLKKGENKLISTVDFVADNNIIISLSKK